jgi:hypothetical protein
MSDIISLKVQAIWGLTGLRKTAKYSSQGAYAPVSTQTFPFGIPAGRLSSRSTPPGRSRQCHAAFKSVRLYKAGQKPCGQRL